MGDRRMIGRVLAAVVAVALVSFTPASVSADCLTAMIVDHSAAADLHYRSCKEVEQRLDALEQAERERRETRGMSEWTRQRYQADIDEFRAKRQLKDALSGWDLNH
jgi:hypothetical protein